ncbi:MAG TPA: class I SAM-dependent methyltransferase [Deltaproteobacteria bacterium]|nr:class I SAM-dependent methyltransferase [Deltaproteobacteria bacterium]
MGKKENLKRCACCGHKKFRLFIESNGERIVRCEECGLLIVNPRPTQEAIKQLFEEEYISTEDRVKEDFTNYRTSALRREAKRIKRFKPEGGRLLDIGTASGAFLLEFQDNPKWQVEGVEPSRYAAEMAAKLYNLKVHCGFLADQAFPDKHFDVVTSLDAFMFHPEPREDLKEISRILKPGGLFAVEIPGLNFRLLKNSGPLCKLIYGVPARLNAGVHLFYYSRSTMGAMVGQFGFKEIAIFPEQSPVYGNTIVRTLNFLYYVLSGSIYKLTGGQLSIVPKEFIIYRKEKL